MSNALPMTTQRRYAIYTLAAAHLSVRQISQLGRMGLLEDLRSTGALTHGASGARVRKPHKRRSKTARGVA